MTRSRHVAEVPAPETPVQTAFWEITPLGGSAPRQRDARAGGGAGHERRRAVPFVHGSLYAVTAGPIAWPRVHVQRIHAAVDKLLEWQRRPGKTASGDEFAVSRFVVAITCRVNLGTPADALARLKRIVETNRTDYASYRQALHDRAVENLDLWATDSPLDFFMSSWPKEIARIARQKSWNITIRDHAFYERQNDVGEDYHMVCLVVEFEQAPICDTYLSAVTTCLDASARTEIPRFEATNGDGAVLLQNLREIVELRNTRARDVGRSELPDPLAEISRLRLEGLPI